ncbi:MAG TPA: redoxin domain-containing protein, partial [Dehalococcoidia bacterium]|nr:redoxin domain-containing protein [Dehalococcoidia bacterium]
SIPSRGSSSAIAPAPAGLEISGADISGITQSGAVIKWATSEPAGGHISYGKTESLEHSQNSDELLTQQRIDLTGLDAGSTYYFRLDAVTKDGRNAFPYSSSFNTLPAPDVTPPLISQVEVWGISDIEARISWQTDEKTASVIEYGLSSRYGKSITLEGEPAQQHTYTLSGLTPQTTYHFRIRSMDASDNSSESEDSVFSTLEEIKVGYAAGNRAPDFTLQSLDGRTWTLSALRGRLVMVNFWRLSCGPCVAELPHFDTVYRTHEGSRPLDLLAVNLGDYTTHLNNMVAEKGYAFNILLQGAGVGSKYGISSIPMTFFIDEDGIIQKVKRGKFNSPDEIREILNSLQL